MEEGIQQGIQQGIEPGIADFITDNNEKGIPIARSVLELQQKFGITSWR